jgi:hypothetical protein
MQHHGFNPARIQAHDFLVLNERHAPPVRMVLAEISYRRSKEFAVDIPCLFGRCLENRVYNSSSDPWVGSLFIHESIVSPVADGSNSSEVRQAK